VNASIESAAKAAIAAAVEDVSIRPLAPKPSLFIDPAAGEQEAARKPEVLEPAAFIPPQAERLPQRPPRMPRLDELPVPAQNEIRARRGEVREDDHPEKAADVAVAAVGFGRPRTPRPGRIGNRLTGRPMSVPVGGPVSPDRLTGRPMPRPSQPRPDSGHELPVSEYARRAAPQGLDQHGRQAPVHNSSDEDQLDIPAFLRRQAK